MSSPKIIIGLLIGLCSYTSLYLGKGIQKLAIEGIKEKRSFKSKYSGIWIVGTILTALPVFIQWTALIYAPVHVIAPLEGIGLIILLLFSYYVLNEKITAIEIACISLIIGGTVIIAFFSKYADKIAHEDFSLGLYAWMTVGVLVVESAAILISRKFCYRFGGILIGFTAGTFMAFQTVSKRISIIPEVRFLAVVLTFIFAIMTLVFTQFGFAKAKANRVVPSFTSASILIATILSVYVLNEKIVLLQMCGIVVLIVGIVGLSVFKQEKPT